MKIPKPKPLSLSSPLRVLTHFPKAMSIPMELMSIRNPNSTFLHRPHSHPPATLRSLRFQHLPNQRHHLTAPSLVSCTGLRLRFTSDTKLNRSFVAFAASHEDSVSTSSTGSALKTCNCSVSELGFCLSSSKSMKVLSFSSKINTLCNICVHSSEVHFGGLRYCLL